MMNRTFLCEINGFNTMLFFILFLISLSKVTSESKFHFDIVSSQDSETDTKIQTILKENGSPSKYDPSQSTFITCTESDLGFLQRDQFSFLSNLNGHGSVMYIASTIIPLNVKGMNPPFLVPMVLFYKGTINIDMKKDNKLIFQVKIPYELDPNEFPRPVLSSKWKSKTPLRSSEILLKGGDIESIRQKWKWAAHNPFDISFLDSTNRVGVLLTIQLVSDEDNEPLLYFVDRIYGVKRMAIFFDTSMTNKL